VTGAEPLKFLITTQGAGVSGVPVSNLTSVYLGGKRLRNSRDDRAAGTSVRVSDREATAPAMAIFQIQNHCSVRTREVQFKLRIRKATTASNRSADQPGSRGCIDNRNLQVRLNGFARQPKSFFWEIRSTGKGRRMKKHVVLLSSAAAARHWNYRGLSSSGIAVRIEGLHIQRFMRAILNGPRPPVCQSQCHSLRNCARYGGGRGRAPSVSPTRNGRRGHSCLASFAEKTGALNSNHPRPRVKAVGLPAGSRAARAVSGTPCGRSKMARAQANSNYDAKFKSSPDSRAFSLPTSVRGKNLRGA